MGNKTDFANFELKNVIDETLIGQHIKNVFPAENHRLHVRNTFLITRQQRGAESTMLEWIEWNLTRDRDMEYFNWIDSKQHICVNCNPSIG